MSDEEDTAVGVPPTFKNELTDILAHAAANDRTVIEFRTKETESGRRHLAHAIDVTEHFCKMEEMLEDEDYDRPK